MMMNLIIFLKNEHTQPYFALQAFDVLSGLLVGTFAITNGGNLGKEKID